ncbi:glycoside hydrolase [Bacillus sp. LL01]|uniref:glycoside hydrolase family 32 protein n=1 Tax=Bacillus sp. LL01 TaxID=1665556 RepID=UPI00064D4BE4|nr:glycoside hydrolase family 32 protein [Bacillus sp. LL01]KMJ59101.1 glycoside hydrolase [Bacillus sp. LL01]
MTVQYKENHRPQFHFSPKEKWMNDPNGMVFFNKEYHLFYQYHPHGTTWGPMHWGHAVSKDMIHWEELPIALYPDEHGAIFSGSAVVDWNNTTGFFEEAPGLVAIFTHADNYPGTERPRQRQSLAYSKDDGRTWETYEGNPVLSDVDITDYRDPKVFWHEESNKWVMVLATGQTVTIYTSLNLKEWEFASVFGIKEGSHDGVWECPDLFQLPIDGEPGNKKWVMLVSIGDNPKFKEGSRTQYFVGDFDGTTFLNENSEEVVLWLDYGRDNYAGVSWSDIPREDGRRIYIGWMSNWRYANQLPTKEWRSAMTLPRELSLTSTAAGLRILQSPVAEIKTIRGEAESFKNLALDGNEPISYKISELTEIEVKFEKETAESFGLSVLNSKEEKTTISYDAVKEELIVDRTGAGDNSFSESFAAIQVAPLNMDGKTINLQIFVDASSIEVFANNGRIAVTSLVFPHEKADKVNLFSKEGTANVRQLTLTPLKSIWSK